MSLLNTVMRMFESESWDPNHIEFVSLTEKVVSCFLTDEYRYKLVIRVDGKRITVKKTNTCGHLTWPQYNEMVKEAIPLGIDHMVKNLGYRVSVNPEFMDSPVRRRILDGLVRKKVFRVRSVSI